ncbi:MAG: alpha-L-arabinofuranosidase C-terminal domain-containing protein [Thermoguttaceae bacterium]|jgi:alpha-N-arabinofuranosidase
MKRLTLALTLVLTLALNAVAGYSAEVETNATINAEQVGEPISPFIYGQFIEHLGRCIYGGIWSEMLLDRKFYDAPGTYLWQRFGNAKFEQQKEGRFVGEASPKWVAENDEPFGVRQFGIDFISEMRYVGYVWAKLDDGQKLAVTVNFNGRDTLEIALDNPVKTADDGYAKYEFDFSADDISTPKATGTFSIVFQGKGETRLGTASLMPGDNIEGMRADTLELLKELNAPIYRWPGGNFVSGYDWKDGIGDRDRRPPRKNPAWQGIEHNDFGIDEFMTFCRYLGTEADIAVNTGAGQVDSALEELEYVNGDADSPQGKIRAANGHEEPYGVKYWCIGNEMYGDWQIGHMPTEEYALKNNEFVDAFREFDPNLVLISVGAIGAWDEVIMRQCADHMDWISEHFYVQARQDNIEHIEQIADSIRRIADAHRRYRVEFPELKGKDIKIAMDEWNYWYGPHIFGELGTRYFHRDGLGIAKGLHEYYRNSDIFAMANYAQTVNVIGAIKTSQTAAQFETTGLVLKLYRNQYGTNPLKVEAEWPYDVAAATTEDGETLTLAIVNPTNDAVSFSLDFKGLTLANDAVRFEIADPNPMAFNDPDFPQRVNIAESHVGNFNDGVSVAPLSVTLYRVAIEK